MQGLRIPIQDHASYSPYCIKLVYTIVIIIIVVHMLHHQLYCLQLSIIDLFAAEVTISWALYINATASNALRHCSLHQQFIISQVSGFKRLTGFCRIEELFQLLVLFSHVRKACKWKKDILSAVYIIDLQNTPVFMVTIYRFMEICQHCLILWRPQTKNPSQYCVVVDCWISHETFIIFGQENSLAK